MGNDTVVIAVTILLGLVLMLLEIITPTFGVLFGLGLMSFAVAIWRGFAVDATLGWTLLIALLAAIPAYFVILVKFLPHSPLGRHIFLGKAPSAQNDAAPESPRLSELVGKQGRAETPLRPGGAVRIDGSRIMARAERGFIESGTTVTVIKAHGTDVVVRAAEAERKTLS